MVDTKFGQIFNAHPLRTETQFFSHFGHFSDFETLGPHNSGVFRPRVMVQTNLEPAYDALRNALLHFGKIFALWATGVNTCFRRLVKYPKSASSIFFQILNLS